MSFTGSRIRFGVTRIGGRQAQFGIARAAQL
jgi:hypothetical protein